MSFLVQYVEEALTPISHQKEFMKSKIKSIKNALTFCSKIKPKEIHLGGSFAKGTMLKSHLDADLVFAYNDIDEVGKNWNKLTVMVEKTLRDNFHKIDIEPAGNLAIHLKTRLDNQLVNFDVVPCYYVKQPKNMAKYAADDKLYQGMTTIFHTRYVERYKNISYFSHTVRLLKAWKKEHNIPLKSIHLELLAVDVYENILDDIANPGSLDIILYECFDNILQTMEGRTVYPANWKGFENNNYEEYYDEPVLIDPGNPDSNMFNGFLTKAKINTIKLKTEITMYNLKNKNYAEIFRFYN